MDTPNYLKIYNDLIKYKYPEKYIKCKDLLNQNKLTFLNLIEINKILAINKTEQSINQKYKSYQKEDIFEILAYQKKYGLNNSQLAKYFNVSRNSIQKWKKIYI